MNYKYSEGYILGFTKGEDSIKAQIREIVYDFIPTNIHEVELRTKLIELLGEENGKLE